MPTIKITDATVEPVTLAAAKAHLREDLVDPGNDLLISGLITVARQAAEDRLQRTLIQSTWQRTLNCFPSGGGPMQLYMPRVLTVEWVKYINPEGVLTTLDPAAYEVDATEEPGVLMPVHGMRWPFVNARPGSVRVQYQAGYGTAAADVPKPIVQWILLALTDLYENRARSAERPALPHGFADGLLDAHKVWSL